MIALSDKQKEALKKYKIEYEKYKMINELLDVVEDVMLSYVDEHDEPLPQFLELEKIYDEIYSLES